MANKAIVIGAGIAGLALAGRFAEAGRPFAVIEKSRGVGGRLATRRDGDATFDHGAQFFRSSRDNPLDPKWRESGQACLWFEKDGFSHFAAPGGITRLAKFLAPKEELHLSTKAERLIPEAGGWRVKTDSIELAGAALYLTCPLPQSLELLRSSGLAYPAGLETIHYSKALVGLFELEGEGKEVAALSLSQNPWPEIGCVANQQSKKVSKAPAITVVMSEKWSEKNFEAPEVEVLAALRSHFQEYLRENFPGAKVAKASLKKWRYCEPLSRHSSYYEAIGGGVYLLGDAFGGGSIAGAVRSAMAVPI